MVDDAVEQGTEALGITECALVNRVEDGRELGVELVVRVEMGVAEVFDVFCQVAEQEDVLLADFSGNLDLAGCQSSDQ